MDSNKHWDIGDNDLDGTFCGPGSSTCKDDEKDEYSRESQKERDNNDRELRGLYRR